MGQVVLISNPFVAADVVRRSSDVIDKGGLPYDAIAKVRLAMPFRPHCHVKQRVAAHACHCRATASSECERIWMAAMIIHDRS